ALEEPAPQPPCRSSTRRQVRGGLGYPLRLLHRWQGEVAGRAQQPADAASACHRADAALVIVINVKAALELGPMSTADRAAPGLSIEHLLELLWRQLVEPPEVSPPM